MRMIPEKAPGMKKSSTVLRYASTALRSAHTEPPCAAPLACGK